MATPTDRAVPLTSNALVDGLTQGSRWTFAPGSNVITYSFSLNDTTPSSFVTGVWTFETQTAVRRALAQWSNVANIVFVESGSGTVFTSSDADIAITPTGNEIQSGLGAI